MGFEPTRAEHIGLAVQRLNHSATSSDDKLQANVVRSFIKLVLKPYVQSVVTLEKSGAGAQKNSRSRQTVVIRPSDLRSEIFGKSSKKLEYGICLLLFNFMSHYCEMKINSRREIPYLCAPIYLTTIHRSGGG